MSEGAVTMDAHQREQARTHALIDDLRALPAEAAWVEFKESNSDPELIGKLTRKIQRGLADVA